MKDRSILHRLAESGRPAARVDLRGTRRDANAEARYELLGELARGGGGVVHHGRDNDLGREVALKVLREEYLDRPEFVRRFVEEAQIGAQLQHPGIVPVYELGLDEQKKPYFAMKLVKGETLAAKLARRADPGEDRRTLLAVFRDACRTVAYAHARGVIHRDLKPANVMVGSFGEVQVVDWGFAKVLRAGGIADERLAKAAERVGMRIATVRTEDDSEASVAGSVMGTPAYMPPEQALGEVDELDARSDVFCLGGMLCEILTGAPPYRTIGDAALCRLDDALARLDACGADGRLVELSRRAMAPLPKDRPADAQVIADEIAAYLTQAEGRAHRMQVRAAQAQARADRQRRARRFARMIVGGGLAAVLLVGGTFLWIDRQRADRERRNNTAIAAAIREARTRTDSAAALAAAERARDLGGDVTILVATLRARVRRDASVARRDRIASAVRDAFDEACVRLGDPEYTRAQVDATYRRALSAHGLTLATVARELHGAPKAGAIAGALLLWADQRRDDPLLSRAIHAAARGLDPAIGDLDRTVADPGKIDGIAPTRLAIMGWILNRRGEHGKAAALLRAARDRHPGNFWINTTLGATLDVYRSEHAEAVHYFTAARGLRPGRQEPIHALGRSLERAGRYREAIATFARGLSMFPEWTHGTAHLARLHLGVGDADKAETLARGVLARDENDRVALHVLGRCLARKKQWRAAAAYFRRGTLAAELGVALANMKNRDDAMRILREYRTSLPDRAEPCIAASAYFRVRKRYAMAEPQARRATELAPGDGAAWYELALVQDRRGDRAGARQSAKRAVSCPLVQPPWRVLLGQLRD